MDKQRAEAARLFGEGLTQAEVARELGVSRQSVSRWCERYRHGGVKRLKEKAGKVATFNPFSLNNIQ